MKFYLANSFLVFIALTIDLSIISGQVPELILPIGHSDVIRFASYSPDGKKIGTASSDRTVKIWNAENGRLLLTLDGFTDFNTVSTVRFSPDGKSVMTFSEDQSVRIWDPTNGKLLHMFEDRARDESSVKYSPDGKFLLQIQDTIINMWDVQNRKMLRTGVQSFVYDPDGKIIISVSDDGSAKIWDILTGNLTRTIKLNTGYSVFSGAIFSPDASSFMTLSEQEANIFNSENGSQLFTIKTNSESRPCYSPDGKKILAVGDLYQRNGKWKKSSEISFSFSVDSDGLWGPIPGLYDAVSGKLLNTYFDYANIDTLNGFVGNDVPYYRIGFSPNGKNIITISDKCKIWDTESGVLLYQLEGQFDDRTSVFYSTDGNRIIIITGDATRLFDAKSGSLLHSYDAPNFRSYNILEDIRSLIPIFGFSPNGKSFYIISQNNNSVKIWDIQNGNLRLNLAGHSTPVSEAVFSPDGKNILSKSFYNNSTAKIWDLVNGKIINSFEGPEWSNARYCEKGKSIHTSEMTESGRIIIHTWNVPDGNRSDSFELKADSVSRYIFSPDDNTIVVIDTNYNAKILNAKTGAELHKLDGLVGGAKFSPDSKSLVTTSWFDFSNIWDVESGKLLKTLRRNNGSDSVEYRLSGIEDTNDIVIVATPEMPFDNLSSMGKMLMTGRVKKVEFNADGKYLIDVGENNLTASLWDVQSSTLFNSFKGNKAAINPDGTRVLTFDPDDWNPAPKVWDSQTDSLLFKLDDDRFQSGTGRFSPDGKNILIIYRDSAKIWDAQNGQLKRTIHFSGTFCSIDWKSERFMIHENSKLVFFNTATGKELYSLIAIDSADYLVLTPEKYYMCSKNAANKLSWRVGDQLYSFDQYDMQYNRPDIVLERLGNPDTSLIRVYRSAYEKRLRKSGFNEKMFSSEWHTPEMKILNSDTLSNVTDRSYLRLKICATDSKYSIDRLLVWINGVPLYGANGLSLLAEKTDSIVKTIIISLSTGENNIKVSCINEKGVESLKESVDIIFNPQKPVRPDLYIIAMSVSDYKDKHYDLQYAAKDGRDIANMLDSLAILKGDYSNISVDTLFNNRATRKNFFNLKSKLQKTKVNDEVIVFVSGHGLLNNEMDFYFATYDIDFRQPEKRGISFDELESILDGIPARKKLLMMDACHSGEVDKEEISDLLAGNSVSSPDITFRGSVREYNFKGLNPKATQWGISLSNTFELMQELFAGLDQGTGTTVISAAAGKGYALESPQWNNGVFTYSIINGLKNKAADKNRDGIITISELKDYSIKQVQLLTGGKQKPTARRESINWDWKIW